MVKNKIKIDYNLGFHAKKRSFYYNVNHVRSQYLKYNFKLHLKYNFDI